MSDLVSVLSGHGFEYRHRGRENYEGACPRCGGDDRVQILQQGDTRDPAPRWFCRHGKGCGQCEHAGGDLPSFLMTFGPEIFGHEVRFPEACEILGLQSQQVGRSREKSARKSATVTHEPEIYPSSVWLERAEELTARAERELWNSPKGQAYLAKRFIDPETAKAFRIGWISEREYQERESWGLEPVQKKDGRFKKIWISNGLFIPTLRQSGVVAITIRRDNYQKGDTVAKICQVPSGVPALYYMTGKVGQPLVIVEGPLDALLVWQESKGTVSAISPIGTTKKLGSLPSQVVQMIKSAPLAFLMLDNDASRDDTEEDTGYMASEEWLKRFPHLIMYRTPTAKDPGDYIEKGGDFKGFLAYGIQKHLNRVYEIDGHTTCLAALDALTDGAAKYEAVGRALESLYPVGCLEWIGTATDSEINAYAADYGITGQELIEAIFDPVRNQDYIKWRQQKELEEKPVQAVFFDTAPYESQENECDECLPITEANGGLNANFNG